MSTRHLHQTLSPQAYVALFDAIHRQARRERRLAVRRFGRTWLASVHRLAHRLTAPLRHAADAAHPAKA